MSLFQTKIKSEFELDDPRRTIEHREIILKKPFLKRIYLDWYKSLIEATSKCPEGVILEIGSGGGFIKDIYPNVVTSDILELSDVDMVVDACNLPFGNQEISAILMVNVFHHIPDVRKFLKEAERVLKPGGVVAMIEPANTLWSSLIYKNLHHELFDEKRDWSFPMTGPLSGSNSALPYIVFTRDAEQFKKEFPSLRIDDRTFHGGFRYLFSGGVSRKQMLPDFSYNLLKSIEGVLPQLTGMFQTIVLTRI